ncbi:hypothetical protein DPMN_081174 [Dreissena polymorpha]|uniref:Uncharacterized protein n=1 Tax=Dreissena polymorpha TaxID=45954 RepID=A0A9D3Y857_DREPO|nr:hypothetical protein DPMN_081174 [Dreissena polymorpha]
MDRFIILHTNTVSPGPAQTPQGYFMLSFVTALDVPFTLSNMYTVLANLSVSTNVFFDWTYVHLLSSMLYVVFGNSNLSKSSSLPSNDIIRTERFSWSVPTTIIDEVIQDIENIDEEVFIRCIWLIVHAELMDNMQICFTVETAITK